MLRVPCPVRSENSTRTVYGQRVSSTFAGQGFGRGTGVSRGPATGLRGWRQAALSERETRREASRFLMLAFPGRILAAKPNPECCARPPAPAPFTHRCPEGARPAPSPASFTFPRLHPYPDGPSLPGSPGDQLGLGCSTGPRGGEVLLRPHGPRAPGQGTLGGLRVTPSGRLLHTNPVPPRV